MSLDGLFDDLDGWHATDIHISITYGGDWANRFHVAVVVPQRRRPLEARAETVEEALAEIVATLDTEG